MPFLLLPRALAKARAKYGVPKYDVHHTLRWVAATFEARQHKAFPNMGRLPPLPTTSRSVPVPDGCDARKEDDWHACMAEARMPDGDEIGPFDPGRRTPLCKTCDSRGPCHFCTYRSWVRPPAWALDDPVTFRSTDAPPQQPTRHGFRDRGSHDMRV